VAGGGLYGSEAVSMRTAEGFSDVIKRQAGLPVFTSPPEPDCAADIVTSSFVVSYAARFPGVLERLAPASDELAGLLRTVLPCHPFGNRSR